MRIVLQPAPWTRILEQMRCARSMRAAVSRTAPRSHGARVFRAVWHALSAQSVSWSEKTAEPKTVQPCAHALVRRSHRRLLLRSQGLYELFKVDLAVTIAIDHLNHLLDVLHANILVAAVAVLLFTFGKLI